MSNERWDREAWRCGVRGLMLAASVISQVTPIISSNSTRGTLVSSSVESTFIHHLSIMSHYPCHNISFIMLQFSVLVEIVVIVGSGLRVLDQLALPIQSN